MTVEVRDAATVLILRDGPDGIEVFLLRRHPGAVFVAGAYVFPGGAVDPADRHDDHLAELCPGRDDASASARLGLDRGGLAYWVAAVRECFEEAGVLLARDAAGGVLSFDDPATVERFEAHRRDVHRGRRRLAEICREEGLTLDVGRIHWLSRWVTPPGPPRRFDTRFFVARAPVGQHPLHDDLETVASEWLTPAAALARHAAGQIDLVLPTARTLELVDRYADTASFMDDLAAAEAAAPNDLVSDVAPGEAALGENGLRVRLPVDRPAVTG